MEFDDSRSRLLGGGFFAPLPWYGTPFLPFTEPSRIAFAGCWHADSGLAREAMRAASAAGATMLVHTGDALYTSPVAERLVMAVEEEAHTLKMTVVIVRGNHDDPGIYARAAASARRRRSPDGFARLSPRVLHAPNGLRWTWQGVRFAALGGAYSVDRAARRKDVSWWPREVASAREIHTVATGGPADVLVTHDVPAGVALPLPADPPSWWDLAGAEGHRVRLRVAVDAITPQWVMAGHMHIRHSGSLVAKSGQAVRVEVLNRVEDGVDGNILVADLADGALTLRS